MQALSLSTIAQLLCSQDLPVNFASIVGEVDRLLETWVEAPFKARWDTDTIVAFDQPGTRVLVGWTPCHGSDLAGVLTISTGPSQVLGRPVMRPDAKVLCERLVQALQDRIGATEILWRQIACHMTDDWVDLLVDALPDRAPPVSPPDLQEPMAAPAPLPTNVVRLYDAEHAHLRAALAVEAPPAQFSAPMRLAIHSLNATLIMVWGPVGAVALAHGLVKGENMRLAAHLMVLSGLASAVLHSPSGQQAMALLRSL